MYRIHHYQARGLGGLNFLNVGNNDMSHSAYVTYYLEHTQCEAFLKDCIKVSFLG